MAEALSVGSISFPPASTGYGKSSSSDGTANVIELWLPWQSTWSLPSHVNHETAAE